MTVVYWIVGLAIAVTILGMFNPKVEDGNEEGK